MRDGKIEEPYRLFLNNVGLKLFTFVHNLFGLRGSSDYLQDKDTIVGN